jgi:3-oxoacyl-[acyl-carrier-protein] synthase-1/3-oxoacyl-[acyl-carrier-protein] synthase II
MHRTGVAVTGQGALSTLGLGLAENLAALFADRRPPLPPRRFRLDHRLNYPVFELPPSPFDDDRHELSRTSRLGLEAARQALADAGREPAELAGLRVGICLGTTVGGTLNSEPFYRAWRRRENPSLEPVKRFLRSNPADVVARAFNLPSSSPCQTVVNACTSGADAIGIGSGWIRSGICDLVLAGGCDELCRTICNGFISLMVVDEAPCRPFDRRRKGLNLGEGAAVMVLEAEAVAKAKGADRIKGRVAGYGTACDAWHLTAPHPEGRGLRRAFRQALEEAGAEVEDISFINAHGTATTNNDLTEGRVLRETAPGIAFFSTKGFTGHTLGAAGALEAVFTLEMLNRGRIPASAGFSETDPEIGIEPTLTEQAVSGELALSQSLAFGGNNAVLAFSREKSR